MSQHSFAHQDSSHSTLVHSVRHVPESQKLGIPTVMMGHHQANKRTLFVPTGIFPLTELSADLVREICDYLSVSDLKRLRQVCRWTEFQTRRIFASRGYKRARVHLCDTDAVRRLVEVLENQRRFGDCVRSLHVTSSDGARCTHRACPPEQPESLQSLSLRGKATTISDLLTLMPMLDNFSAVGLNSALVAKHLTITATPSPSHPLVQMQTKVLELDHVHLTSAELCATIRSVRLTQIRLYEVTSTDGNWHSILSTLQHSPTKLEQLELRRLCIGQGSHDIRDTIVLKPEDGRPFHKAFKGEAGIEIFAMQNGGRTATAKGAQAVRYCLAEIIQHFTPGHLYPSRKAARPQRYVIRSRGERAAHRALVAQGSTSD